MQISDRFELKMGFSPKAYLFETESGGLVIEKEKQVVCIYVTNTQHSDIFAAIPLAHPGQLKGIPFLIRVSPVDKNIMHIAVGNLEILINFEEKFCSTNADFQVHGSKNWGRDCCRIWDKNLTDKYF